MDIRIHNFQQLNANVAVSVAYVLFYFFPYLVAVNRSKQNVKQIGWMNLGAGWTILGWFACLVWAMADASGTGGLWTAIKNSLSAFARIKAVSYWFPLAMLTLLLFVDRGYDALRFPDRWQWILSPLARVAASALLVLNLPALGPTSVILDSQLIAGKQSPWDRRYAGPVVGQHLTVAIALFLLIWFCVLKTLQYCTKVETQEGR